MAPSLSEQVVALGSTQRSIRVTPRADAHASNPVRTPNACARTLLRECRDPLFCWGGFNRRATKKSPVRLAIPGGHDLNPSPTPDKFAENGRHRPRLYLRIANPNNGQRDGHVAARWRRCAWCANDRPASAPASIVRQGQGGPRSGLARLSLWQTEGLDLTRHSAWARLFGVAGSWMVSGLYECRSELAPADLARRPMAG